MSIALIFVALILTLACFKIRNVLLSLTSGVMWLGLFMWMFFSVTPLIPLSTVYGQLLTWTFLMLTFVPFLALMDTEIKMEKDGKRWSEWGARPKDRKTSYESYKEQLRGKLKR